MEAKRIGGGHEPGKGRYRQVRGTRVHPLSLLVMADTSMQGSKKGAGEKFAWFWGGFLLLSTVVNILYLLFSFWVVFLLFSTVVNLLYLLFSFGVVFLLFSTLVNILYLLFSFVVVFCCLVRYCG